MDSQNTDALEIYDFYNEEDTNRKNNSFNLTSGQVQDSDSGISTDGFQLLEELQSELRAKAHLASKLRSQLDFTDQHHEELISNLTAERDSMRAYINMLREENLKLQDSRRDYEEASERLCTTEAELGHSKKELETLRKRVKQLQETADKLESDKHQLHELLTKSREECHRINEMYASRQATLIEENESLKTDYADLSSRFQDQDEFMQQMLKDKVLLEMELKDVHNKSETHFRLNHSIDVSFTDDQNILSSIDNITANSQFGQHHLLDEESFLNELKGQDRGRSTNMSLFDEIRLSLCKTSKNNIMDDFQCEKCIAHNRTKTTSATQTAHCIEYMNNNESVSCLECDSELTCSRCAKLKAYIDELHGDVKRADDTITSMQSELERYESNLATLEMFVAEGDLKNEQLQSVVDRLKVKLDSLEAACDVEPSLGRVKGCVQRECVYVSKGTQAGGAASRDQPRSLRKFLWDAFKSLFQIFAVGCFAMALVLLYQVTQYERRARRCGPAAGGWLGLLDFLFRVEYVGEVPM